MRIPARHLDLHLLNCPTSGDDLWESLEPSAKDWSRKKRCYFFDRSGQSFGFPFGNRFSIWGNIRAFSGLHGYSGKEHGNYYDNFHVFSALVRGCCVYGDSCTFEHSSSKEGSSKEADAGQKHSLTKLAQADLHACAHEGLSTQDCCGDAAKVLGKHYKKNLCSLFMLPGACSKTHCSCLEWVLFEQFLLKIAKMFLERLGVSLYKLLLLECAFAACKHA